MTLLATPTIRFFATFCLVSLLLTAGVVVVRAAIVSESGDLLNAIETVRANMPGRDDEGFVPPTGTELDLWRDLMQALLADDVGTVDTMLTTHFPFYELVHYTDSGFENRQYYLLRETLPVTKGWGTYIINPQYHRELAIEVPHPRYEINTPSEGADIFRRTGARLLTMTGTHRCSNEAQSPCDGSSSVCGDGTYHVSDQAHFVDAPFQVAHEVFTDNYPVGYGINLHGTSRSECNDIFLTNGVGGDSKPILYDLKNHMNASGNIVVSVSGDGTSSCSLIGSTNVQGRYTNGSPDPCETAAGSSSGYFIHAEQSRHVRDNPSIYFKFINAINDAIEDVVTGIPGPPVAPERIVLDVSTPYPNPFVTQTRFSVTPMTAQQITVDVIGVSGRRIVRLHDGFVGASETVNLSFQSRRLPSGVYLLRVSGKGVSVTRKITIVR